MSSREDRTTLAQQVDRMIGDRQPAALEAELAVLGSMIIDSDVIPEVIEVLNGEQDFFSNQHAALYVALVDLWSQDDKVDLVTLHQYLKDRGKIDSMGGIDWLVEVGESVPHSKSAVYYAGMVRAKAAQRRVIEASISSIEQVVSNPERPAAETIEDAERRIFNIASEAEGREGGEAVGPVLVARAKEIRESQGKPAAGLETGLPDMDRFTGGLHDGEMTVIAARPGLGKAQPLSAGVLTTSGYRKMGDMRVGDPIVGRDGNRYHVTAVHPQGYKSVYRVRVCSGGETECCDDHLWLTWTREDRENGQPMRVRSLKEIRQTLRDPGGPNHCIPWSHDQARGDPGFTRPHGQSIVDVQPAGVKECQCIEVDAPDRLYVTDGGIVTHNSAMSLNIAEHLAFDADTPCAFYSMEMGKGQIADRIFSARTNLRSDTIRANRVSKAELDRIDEFAARSKDAPLYIDDTASLSPMLLRAKARRMHSRYGIKAMFVDYLQLMTIRGAENRQQEVTQMSREMKLLARDLNIPVIVLSQLNRGVESRDDKRPKLSDLRESGSIEQDADNVWMIFRKDYYERGGVEYSVEKEAEIIVCKQRQGPSGTVKLSWNGEFARFGCAYQGTIPQGEVVGGSFD